VNVLPSGPCCKVSLKEYDTLQDAQHVASIPRLPTSGRSSSVESHGLTLATTSVSDTSSEPELPISSFQEPLGPVSTFREVELAPRPEPEIVMLSEPLEIDSLLSEFDWSGKGAHLKYDNRSEVPLELISILGVGGSSSVHKVRTKNKGSIL
jgi:hypothetical protein